MLSEFFSDSYEKHLANSSRTTEQKRFSLSNRSSHFETRYRLSKLKNVKKTSSSAPKVLFLINIPNFARKTSAGNSSLQWGNQQRKCKFYSLCGWESDDMFECMGQKCPFVSQPKLLPIDFRGSTSYVSSFFARAMALIAHA